MCYVPPQTKKCINIGAGKDIKISNESEQWTNLDTHNRFGSECIWDINNIPFPFESNSFDYLLCSHVIEDFISPMPLIKEMVRICKVGGQIEIKVPHEKSKNCHGSIAHKKYFNGETLYYIGKVSQDYDSDFYPPVKVVSLKYYSCINWKNFPVALYKTICVGIRNIFGVSSERWPIIRSISSPDMSIAIIFEKTK